LCDAFLENVISSSVEHFLPLLFFILGGGAIKSLYKQGVRFNVSRILIPDAAPDRDS
jgi:hypothetical protein